MPYVAEQDVTVPRVIATGVDPEGREYQETESVVYPAGAVIDDDQIAPVTQQALDDGDEHASSLLRHVSDSEADKIRAAQAAGAVAPEHEAEAEVFSQEGKDVLTRDEVTSSNPNGDPPPAVPEVDDPTEGREAADPEGLRVQEVDDSRRGDSPAPEAKAPKTEKVAPKPKSRSRAKKK